jgi:hypothetical protein
MLTSRGGFTALERVALKSTGRRDLGTLNMFREEGSCSRSKFISALENTYRSTQIYTSKRSSVVTSKAAIDGHLKTGQRKQPEQVYL